MKIYNTINKNGYFSGISTQGGISVPIKPLVNNERARFVDGKWEYEFTKEKKSEDATVYNLFGHSIYYMYTGSIIPLNGDIILKKSEDISVLIPCYDKADYIVDCVKSCVNQTMSPKEIVILLMDEKSQAMKEELENISDLITCIISEQLNVVKARVKLVNEYCNTDWFILLDADDMLCENFIEVAYNRNASVVFPRVQLVNEDGEIGSFEDGSQNNILKTSSISNAMYNNLTSLMNKEVFNEVKLDEDLCYGGEDIDFIIRLLALKKYKIDYVYSICYYYREVDGLSSKKSYYISHYKSLKKNLDFLHEEYVAINGYQEFEDDFYKNPTLETYVQYSNLNRLDVLTKKEEELRYKLYLSKKKTPIAAYDYYKFTTIGNAQMNELCYAGKEFDVIFTEEITHTRIVSDKVNAIINKDILPEIEGLKGLVLIEYLLDNYCCFEELNPPVEIFTNEEELQLLDNVNNEAIQEQLKLVDIPKKPYKSENIVNINFALHNVCNLKCEYCSAKYHKSKVATDDEVYENFDKALTLIEEKFKGKPIQIGILGGEPTLFSNELILKIVNRLKNYRKIILFTNGTNKNSIWYNYDNIIYAVHVTDWKEHPEKLCIESFDKNETPIIVITSEDIDKLEEVLNNYDVVENLRINACTNSPIAELDLSKEELERLNQIITKHGLSHTINSCYSQGSTIQVNCENLELCKKCCKQKTDFTLEEALVQDKEYCKECIFYDTCRY